MAVSSIGVGSGLPLDKLLVDLRNSENQSLVAIQTRQAQAQGRLSGYGQIQSSLEALKTAAEKLGKTDTFGALKATSSSDAFTATASNTAIAGQYSITVNTLAGSQTLASNGVADRKEAIGTGGNITVTLANGDSQTLNLGNDTSINGLIKAINTADPSLGIRATVVNDGDPSAPYRLMLTSAQTGTESAASKIEVAGNAQLQALLGYDAADPGASAMSEKVAATNATLSVNSIAVTSQTNNVEGVIEGITLNLVKGNGEASSLKVEHDNTVATKAIKDFVSAYNNVQNTIKSLTNYDVEAQRGSALTGDSLARRVQTQARDALLNSFAPEGAIRSLADMGITISPTTGLLETNEDKLSAAIKNNLGDVTKLFAGDNGLSKRFTTMAENFLGSTGYLQGAKDGTNRSITDLQRQYTDMSSRIDAKMENYRRQFAALDSMMAQMNSVSSYLSQQLSMLGNLNDSK